MRARRWWLIKLGPAILTRTLGKGEANKKIILEAAQTLMNKHWRTGFLLRDLYAEVRSILQQRGLLSNVHTSDLDGYMGSHDRIVRGRFGEMHRDGFFTPNKPDIIAYMEIMGIDPDFTRKPIPVVSRISGQFQMALD